MLMAPLRAGTWHLIGDSEDMRQPVTVRFDIIWRSRGTDVVLASTSNDFVPFPPGPQENDAILFETDLEGIAGPASPGDQLVLKFTTTAGDAGAYYIPNGDGAAVRGRTVRLHLP